MKNILLLIRPHQWIKNLFLFAPLFFTFNFQSESFLNVTLGFIVFSLAASSIYILNDYKDILEDQAHPTKKHRPLASGAVSKQTAIGLMVVLSSIAIYGGFVLSPSFLAIIIIYMLLNVAYTFKLKHASILDISIISIGFVLRVYAGAPWVKLENWYNEKR